MTTSDIELEWQYRYDEAISLGRSPERAWREADEWEAGLTLSEQTRTNDEQNILPA
jgi:hypothetical protein